MQVIDVLCDDDHLALWQGLFQTCQCGVGGVRAGLDTVLATRVIEFVDQGGVGGKAFGRGDLIQVVFGPQAILVAKGAKAAFGGNARTGQDDDLGHGPSNGYDGGTGDPP